MAMARRDDAADVGRQALAALRLRVGERLVGALDHRDPELLASLSEVGVLRRAWVEEPGSGPMSAPAADVMQRVLERTVERRPSVLASMGLSAIQLLTTSTGGLGASEGGTVARAAVMFTDLEGFTRFTARAGDDAAAALLSDHHRAAGPVIRSRGGRIVKRLGDGLLLTFPEPEAAVLAAVELVASEPGPLALRAGIHVGEVLASSDDVIGHVVNVAARVTEQARGGQVLVTTDVRDRIAASLPHIEFARARRRHLKGLDAPVAVCRVLHRSDV
ncbi:MAG: hypothetical protein NVS3B21_07600 [Acidimicrobiales bacterium]